LGPAVSFSLALSTPFHELQFLPLPGIGVGLTSPPLLDQPPLGFIFFWRGPRRRALVRVKRKKRYRGKV